MTAVAVLWVGVCGWIVVLRRRRALDLFITVVLLNGVETLTYLYVIFSMTYVNLVGITAGVHRLWTHKCYKAAFPVRLFLMLAFTSSGQNSIYAWVLDHRVHHKCSDTDGDPYNINRGFTFAHFGWLMLQKNNLVLEKGRQIDMSDILQDPVAAFNKKYWPLLRLLTCYVIPTTFGILVLDEKWQCAVAWHCFFRIIFVVQASMMVNSVGHKFGSKPYNKHINSTQNRMVSIVTLGECWHNYHHMFPNDYKASETFDIVDGATFFIRTCAKMGLAWDLKEPSPELIKAVINKHNGRSDKKNEIPDKDSTLDEDSHIGHLDSRVPIGY